MKKIISNILIISALLFMLENRIFCQQKQSKIFVPSAMCFGTAGCSTSQWRAALFEEGINPIPIDFAWFSGKLPNESIVGVLCFQEAEVQLKSQLLKYGGRVVLFTESTNVEVYQTLFGVSIAEEKGIIQSIGGQYNCDGGKICPLWKGLSIGTPMSVDYYFTVNDKSNKVLTYIESQQSHKNRIVSVKMTIGKGELLILPLFVRDIMSNSYFNLLDNEEAGRRLGRWLVGDLSF